MKQNHLAIALTVLASAAASQPIVSPYASTNTYANSNNAVPWGWPSPTSTQGEVFYQQIDDGLLGRPRVLSGFAFRHSYTATHAAWTYVLTVKIGTAATPASGISMTYASNWKPSTTPTTVFNGPVTFPALSSYPRPPSPPDAPVPFTTPHVYAGTEPLLWELYIQGLTPAGPTKQSHERGSTGGQLIAGMLGTGCPITGGTSPMSSSGSITGSTTLMTDTLANGPANAPAVLLLGDEADLLGGSLPLPIDLAIVGSPGCFLRINPIINVSFTTSASGGALFSLPYTMTPAISGVRLRSQWGAIDSANLVRTSNGLDHAVPFHASGNPWPQNSVYSSNFGATPPAVAYANYVSGIVTAWK